MQTQFSVVLVEPEIPQNTGSIGRLCLATKTKLHLVEPLGFELTHSRLKRAGLDYWEHLDVMVHSNLDSFFDKHPFQFGQFVFFSKKATKVYYQHTFHPETFFFFGKETKGLPSWLLDQYASSCLQIPIFDSRVRSLNLANAVGIGLYEGIRQQSS